MAAHVGIWSINHGVPQRTVRSRVDLEADLEDWCATDPSLLVEGLRIVGRQVHCEGGYIDLLGIDVQERWVIVELKRARLYREALIQAIDYASSIRHMEPGRLRATIEKSTGSIPGAEAVLEQVESQLSADEDRREVAIVVAGTATDKSLDRVVEFLSDFDLPLRVVTFDVFEEADGSRLLIREVLEEEGDTPIGPERRKVRTIDQIAAVAERQGVGEAFRRIVTSAEKAELFCRPYVHSVMVTPPSNKGRYLMVLTPQEGRGLRFSYGPDSFAEFFDVDSQDVEVLLGPDGCNEDAYLTPDDWEAGTTTIVEFLQSLPDPVAIDEDRRADFATVSKYAALVRPGEWTTYRDLSTAAIGRSSASMAVGGMARRRPDFPNAHRVLGHTGLVSPRWRSESGGGPDECRAMLADEGLSFLEDGSADAGARVAHEELTRRLKGEG